MSFLFKGGNNNQAVEKIKFEEVIDVNILKKREAIFRIINTSIIYNGEEEYY
jgi:hypothetical protein